MVLELSMPPNPHLRWGPENYLHDFTIFIDIGYIFKIFQGFHVKMTQKDHKKDHIFTTLLQHKKSCSIKKHVRLFN